MIQFERQLTDFARSSLQLFWQRQATILAGTLLAMYYIDATLALTCYAILETCEILDFLVLRRILHRDVKSRTKTRRLVNLMMMTGFLTSAAVVFYMIVMAIWEGPGYHLGPLFFLFSAMLYTAMNNCQIPRVMALKLCVFSAGLIFIPVYDLWLVKPDLGSELWKQFGIVLFVLLFVMECSRKFLKTYTNSLKYVDELRLERNRVRAAFSLQSQFVAIVSHELRTPLTTVNMSLDLINTMSDKLPDELEDIAKLGQNGGKRLSVLIDDLLDFQKLKSGNMQMDVEPVNVADFVRRAVEQNQSLGKTRNIAVKVHDMDAHVMVLADTDRLLQVMTNVLSNAIKFSHEAGQVDVHVEADDQTVKILVSDHGIGIPENSQHAVFAPFQQVSCPDKREHGGTGLGMSISKDILAAHGGSISFTSAEGVGTTFSIELDRHADDYVSEQLDTHSGTTRSVNCAAE